MQRPVIAIIGRPNVGKSTLFNCLTKTRAALIADQPGLTRDRQYGEGESGGQEYIVIDTGGLIEKAAGIDALLAKHAWQAVTESDAVIFLTDGRAGINPDDTTIADKLQHLKMKKIVFLVVNKTDGIDPNLAIADFYELGMGEPYPIAAAHGRGVTELLNKILGEIPKKPELAEPEKFQGIKIAFVGRPNVGKSTLINRILGEERVIVYDQPGTTRDSIFVPFERREKKYILIDTAGVRRRSKTKQAVEKFSIIKTFQAIETANVAVFIIDARENIAEQDLRLLGFIIDAGKALVIAVNKWDGLTAQEKEQVKKALDRRLTFIDFADIHFISALHGTGVGGLFKSIHKAYDSATKKLSTPMLTRVLQQAVVVHEPPLVRGKRVKLRYAHAGGQNPPLIIIHGARTKYLSASYRKYLANTFRKQLKLFGTPIRIECIGE